MGEWPRLFGEPQVAKEMSLLDGDAFREIPRLVDLAAADAGDVIGEELKCDDGRDGGDERVARRDGDEIIHALGGLVVALGDDA